MNKLIISFSTVFVFLFTQCDKPESPVPHVQEFGYLSMSIALQLDAISTSGRVEAVSPDNFIVTIFNTDNGSIVEQWNTYLEVPEEVQLPTGSYYVTATNLSNPEAAAFEQPWYYGESEVFTIDKEELKTINVNCTLANCKISFSYSQNVQDNFTNWNATATIDDGNGTGAFLEWIQNEPAEGYFMTDLPINLEVYLEYIKVFEPEVSITRTFNHTITNPMPATHYMVNVDASLEDGEIMINITVDDSFETEEINLGDSEGILVIWDVINEHTNSLVSYLQSEGHAVTLSETSETSYNGSNPPLDGFDVVIHLNGTTHGVGMPLAGQNALIDFVMNDGKTYVTDEWSAYEVDVTGGMSTMSEIVVLERSSGYTGVATYSIVSEQAGHSILSGIPSSFALPYGGSNVGVARSYSGNQPTVLMTWEQGDAVVVRDFENGGKAIGFAHAGNYNNSAILSDTNVQGLYENAVSY